MIKDLLRLWLLTPGPWLCSVFISGRLTPVPWLRLCDSMPPSLFYFWLHDSGLVTALTIDSGSVTLVCFHFWFRYRDSGPVTVWLRLCDSMPPSLFYFWSHDSGLVTALTIDSGSVTLFCFHFWFLDSGTVTPVLWPCDSDYVTLCLRVCFISGPMIPDLLLL